MEQVDIAFIYIIGFSLLLLVLITALMIFFVVKYRQSRNPRPSDIRGNWRLEVAWTAVPTVIALSMFAVGWTSYLGLRNVPKNALQIDVIAQQFSYVFTYPNKKMVENLLVVPLGSAVKLNARSEDVLHGLYIPAYRIKVDVLPGMRTHAWFRADKIGKYDILCTEYCGHGHADMRAVLKIVPKAEYEKWLKTEQ